MEKIYSVTEFVREIKNYVDDMEEFQGFFIEGELSNVTYYKSGHLYFSLKDSKSQIRCTAFNYKQKKVPEDLKEGDTVKIFGDINFYEVRGEFQLLARYIEKNDALGSMLKKLEELKIKMEEEGYFLEEHKKELPKYPKNIGVVTALTGAALQDIIKTTKKRFNSINIYVYPARVQGIGAKEEIIKGIEILNEIEEIDFIIAGRGGGSIEDLWAFNEEEVAKAFYYSKKPIISAVGHEIDNLLSDLTADVRAATPTQAVELSVPEKKYLIEEIKDIKKEIDSLMMNKIKNMKKDLLLRKENYNIKKFPENINKFQNVLVEKEELLNKSLENYITQKKEKIVKMINKLDILSPLKTLKRGYSVTTKNNKKINFLSEIKENDIIKTRLEDGIIISVVKEKIDEKNNY